MRSPLSKLLSMTTKPATIRRWARLSIAAQLITVAAFLVAAVWQGPRYSVRSQDISDMYALTAPAAGSQFLIDVFALAGAVTIWFTLRSVWPALRAGGRAATIGSALLALSVAGLGNLLSPVERLACRAADPGCTPARQLADTGGKLDSILTTVGLLLIVLAALFLAAAMHRIPDWRAWAWPTRATAVLLLALGSASPIAQHAGYNGLFERLFAATAAAALSALSVGILRRTCH